MIEANFEVLNALIRNLKSGYYVDIGILGNESGKDGLSIAEIGAVQEYGSIEKKIPARSFIKMPLLKKEVDISNTVQKKFQDCLDKGDVKKIFTLIGIAGESAIQDAFDTGGFGTWDALSQVTINAKGSSKILIDDGTMRKSITSKVGKGTK